MPALTYTVGTFTAGRTQHIASEDDSRKFSNTEKGKQEGYTYYIYKEMATGASEATKLNNIYDLAGNMHEWTTEIGYHGKGNTDSSTKYAVLRGGSFSNGYDDSPISCRNGNNGVDSICINVGFRVTLYAK